jgi:hypothetical protein
MKADAIPDVSHIKITEECGIAVLTLNMGTSKYSNHTVCK